MSILKDSTLHSTGAEDVDLHPTTCPKRLAHPQHKRTLTAPKLPRNIVTTSLARRSIAKEMGAASF